MSAPGPESIPTSADPKSRRPTKKRALSPSSAHTAHLEALFAKPDQNIRIPPPTSNPTTYRGAAAAPPEIVTNVQGSSAGAGSGEFHVYKASRRREYERLRQMEHEALRDRQKDEFDTAKSERDRRDEERTRKNREKREKMKARKGRKGKKGTQKTTTKTGGNNGGTGDDDTKIGVASGAPKGVTSRRDALDSKVDRETAASVQPVGLVIHDED